VAFGAPGFVFSDVAVGVDEGEGVSVGDGVSLGSGVGDFFFRFAEGEALGDGEACFFFADAPGDGDADSFFVVADFFFLCGVGVGVAVEKILLIFSPTVSSAERAGEAPKNASKRRIKPAKRIMWFLFMPPYHCCHCERMRGSSLLVIIHASLDACDQLRPSSRLGMTP
jgi:hypothetical protein